MRKFAILAVLMTVMNVSACGNNEEHHTNTEIEHKPVIVKYDNSTTKTKLRCYQGGYCKQCWYEVGTHKYQCSPNYYVSENEYGHRNNYYRSKCDGNHCQTCWKGRNKKWSCKKYQPWY